MHQGSYSRCGRTYLLVDAHIQEGAQHHPFCCRQESYHFAAAKNHIGIYPGPEAVLAFEESLHDYKTSKGAIQIPLDKEIPKDLIAEIAKYSYRLATEKH